MSYDQGAVTVSGNFGIFEVLIAEAWSIRERKNQILARFDRLFWPAAERASARSSGDALYWQRCTQSMHDSVNNQDRDILEVVPVPSTFARDPLIRLKKEGDSGIESCEEKTVLGAASKVEEEVEEETPVATA